MPLGEMEATAMSPVSIHDRGMVCARCGSAPQQTRIHQHLDRRMRVLSSGGFRRPSGNRHQTGSHLHPKYSGYSKRRPGRRSDARGPTGLLARTYGIGYRRTWLVQEGGRE